MAGEVRSTISSADWSNIASYSSEETGEAGGLEKRLSCRLLGGGDDECRRRRVVGDASWSIRTSDSTPVNKGAIKRIKLMRVVCTCKQYIIIFENKIVLTFPWVIGHCKFFLH